MIEKILIGVWIIGWVTMLWRALDGKNPFYWDNDKKK